MEVTLVPGIDYSTVYALGGRFLKREKPREPHHVDPLVAARLPSSVFFRIWSRALNSSAVPPGNFSV